MNRKSKNISSLSPWRRLGSGSGHGRDYRGPSGIAQMEPTGVAASAALALTTAERAHGRRWRWRSRRRSRIAGERPWASAATAHTDVRGGCPSAPGLLSPNLYPAPARGASSLPLPPVSTVRRCREATVRVRSSRNELDRAYADSGQKRKLSAADGIGGFGEGQQKSARMIPKSYRL